MQYRPALADIPDQKGWRIQDADYGSLSRFARGKIDLEKIKRHWSDILRVVLGETHVQRGQSGRVTTGGEGRGAGGAAGAAPVSVRS